MVYSKNPILDTNKQSVMKYSLDLKQSVLLFLCIFLFSFKGYSQTPIEIYFPEYSVTIREIPKLGDTLKHNYSSIEDYKFVFYDRKGKCYCERYINKKLYEKGTYENSLDTLKRYTYGRSFDGRGSAPIKVVTYFQPLKNGEWTISKDGKVIKKTYVMGILKEDLINQK
jgi:hypothetical protein